MKLLLDFLPILLFFGMFKYAEGQPEWAAATASQWLGFMVEGSVVGPAEAPVLLATVVVITATLLQVAFLMLRGRKVDTMLWVSLALVVVLGGATIYFHSETFIKWKPTLLYWSMAGGLLIGQLMGKNGIRALMGSQMTLPEPVWLRVNQAWMGFFGFMGALNLWVAYQFSTGVWVNFKLFGGMGLMLLFVVAQTLVLGKYIQDDEETGGQAQDNPGPKP
ncbi:MAG: septation protein A [Betaproteobacteria bacterium]